jgi:hypothetical protein
MSVVFQAISAVASDLAAVGVAKSTTNPDDGYDYRSIDALMNRLSPNFGQAQAVHPAPSAGAQRNRSARAEWRDTGERYA